jgi:hypothetical protein
MTSRTSTPASSQVNQPLAPSVLPPNNGIAAVQAAPPPPLNRSYSEGSTHRSSPHLTISTVVASSPTQPDPTNSRLPVPLTAAAAFEAFHSSARAPRRHEKSHAAVSATTGPSSSNNQSAPSTIANLELLRSESSLSLASSSLQRKLDESGPQSHSGTPQTACSSPASNLGNTSSAVFSLLKATKKKREVRLNEWVYSSFARCAADALARHAVSNANECASLQETTQRYRMTKLAPSSELTPARIPSRDTLAAA